MIQYSTINDAWGNKEIYKKNNIDNFQNKEINNIKPQNESVIIQPQNNLVVPPIVENQNIHVNNELFNNTSCSFAEHLKNCQHCRNSLAEYFNNDTNQKINVFGINITKDLLNIIFIIIIILIFIILLSMINISLKDNKSMKYFMLPPNNAFTNYYR